MRFGVGTLQGDILTFGQVVGELQLALFLLVLTAWM
jgi:hypothetical protein